MISPGRPVVATTTSASAITSSIEPISIPCSRARAWASCDGSNAITLRAPPSTISEAIPNPAAPRPSWPTVAEPSSIPACRQATIAAATDTTAVPWTSSCITGCGSASISRRSISKHSGAEMSSRWIPPNVGAIRTTVDTNPSTSSAAASIRIGIAEIPANCR